MSFDKRSLLLYAVTDRSWLSDAEDLPAQLEKALRGGVSFVQLREKDFQEQHRADAVRIQTLCRAAGVPFLINDHAMLAQQLDADGVHVGQGDMDVAALRSLLGADKIIGVSVQTVTQAQDAQARGADYLGVGAMFQTSTKTDAAEVSMDTLREICAAVSIPVVAIGGIGQLQVPLLQDSGIAGIAVVSALFAAKDIESAAKLLRKACEEVF